MLSSDVDVLRFLVDKGLDPKEEVRPSRSVRSTRRARPAVVEFAMARGVSVPKDMLIRAQLAASRFD